MTTIELTSRGCTCLNIEGFVSIEEFNKIKKKLEIKELEKNRIQEQRDNTLRQIELLETIHRRDVVIGLHHCIAFKNDEERNKSIDSFYDSKMSLREIREHLDTVRKCSHPNQTQVEEKYSFIK